MADSPDACKSLGAFYTPPDVAETLVRWVVRSPTDHLLDPSCGDGRFLAAHSNVVGVDRDPHAVATVAEQVRHATVVAADFFEWANSTRVKFDCAAGNPPFIRYQRFRGETRKQALKMCSERGATFSGLTSSWAPFLVVAASLLKRGGRIAFVVPAEIGHAPYARPLLEYLMDHFRSIRVVAVRDKVFPNLSEDVWFLYAEGYGESCGGIGFSRLESFRTSASPPRARDIVSRSAWEEWNGRLRPYLVSDQVREMYRKLAGRTGSTRLGEIAKVGIGYVTGANSFFHVRPSEASRLEIPQEFLVPTVRKSSFLPQGSVTQSTIDGWIEDDEPVLLLRIPPNRDLPKAVREYLDSDEARQAQLAYKCRMRTPWYTVPDVRIPDAFLSYMSGLGPSLVANTTTCVCTNSVHAVHLTNGLSAEELVQRWRHPLVSLSCELEGHPLGGGMLKIEPREAANVVIPAVGIRLSAHQRTLIDEGIGTMRRWRHYA
ncbi:MAG: SAM-dependent DNA methyltransferase [Planctomycetes bacterium]|nr:SAM-dependent DNA methyltransferase [Planctomycetota bacterium]